ncbi:MAG: S6e family ribosomal protein [Candidatus Woesearchaeota archaeon]
MVEFKCVISTKDGKSYQKEIKSPEADVLAKKKLGDTVSGDEMGFSGYEFEITGGSDKCGFPMRKGVQAARKKVFISGGVGFCGKNRNNKKQKGLNKRRTVCGERITSIIRQVNLKAVKEGAQPLGEAPAVAVPAEEPKQ